VSRPIRTLVVASAGKPPEAELRRLIANDAMPDAVAAELTLNPTYVDDRLMATLPGLRGRLIRRLPYMVAQAIEVRRLGKDYDAVFTWSDLPSLLVAGAMLFWRGRPGQVALLYWPSKPKKAIAWRLMHPRVDRFIVTPPLQRRFMLERVGVSADRIVDARYPVDTQFWRQTDAETDRICAVGQEMRDYGTFLEALRPLGIPCHIAVGAGVFGTTSDRWWKDSLKHQELPAGVTVGNKSFTELRDLYARSKFVVLPLLPSDMDNGITALLEAFAMAKPVIVTDTPGQVGVLEDGVNCLRVPPFDVIALRDAIVRLWNDPELCTRLGTAGRELVVARHRLDLWGEALRRGVEEASSLRVAARGRD
jgi:glycosyltransferase involved in cell wall biosynthesis